LDRTSEKQSDFFPKISKLLEHGVGLIDTIILMHGIKSNSKIWTQDNKFLRIIPKELKYSE
jgi:hypothetical protein